MNNMKVSNKIFSMGLSLKEIAVYAYLCSITIAYKRVRQATIARACGFRTTEAVSRTISSLKDKGLIKDVLTTQKSDNRCGTNIYTIYELSCEESFFFFPRRLFKCQLSYKELAVLLFQYHAYSPERGLSWNSYNDICKTIKLKRSELIAVIKGLTEKQLLRKRSVKSPQNKKVFADNRYVVIWFDIGHIKKAEAHLIRIGEQPLNASLINTLPPYYSAYERDCQEFSQEKNDNFELADIQWNIRRKKFVRRKPLSAKDRAILSILRYI